MLSRTEAHQESEYAFKGEFLNAVYLAGFARRRKDLGNKAFALQQTNNVSVALPVNLKESWARPPQDTDATSVIGHLSGKLLPNGERIAICEAIMLDVPSIRDMPNQAAWEKKVPEGGEVDTFKPFFSPDDKEDVYSSVFFKSGKPTGRSCKNVVRIAGFVEAYNMSKTSQGGVQRDCLLIALRQTRDPNKSIPVRLYGRFSEAFRNEITVGRPIFIEGQYRVRLVKRPTKQEGTDETMAAGEGEEIRAREAGKVDADAGFTLERYPYVHCSNIKLADRRMIKSDPDWWNDMKVRFIAERRDRAKQALSAAIGKSAATDAAQTPVSSVVTSEEIDDQLDTAEIIEDL